jgi:hemerythrin-like metal-binding protein
MPTLTWSDALSLQMPVMDRTHVEFVDLLAAVEHSDDTQLTARWAALVAHTAEHFAQEDAWMAATGFAPDNCHATQHKVVLQVLREGLQAGEAGQLQVIRQMASELALWFPQHAQTMDAALALHMKSLGHDPETGRVAHPDQWPAQAISGCGGACSAPSSDALSPAAA